MTERTLELRADATAWGHFDLEDGIGGALADQPDGFCASRQDADQRVVRAAAAAAHVQRGIDVLDLRSRSRPAVFVVVVAVAFEVAGAVVTHGPQSGHISRADCGWNSLIIRVLGQRVGIGRRVSASIGKEVVVEAVAGNGGAVIGSRVFDKLGWQLQEGMRLHDWGQSRAPSCRPAARAARH